MPDLPKYGTAESCPKCGASAGVSAESVVEPDASTVYHEWRMPRETPAPPCSRDVYARIGEHICRVCQVCGYGWCEAVLS
jgi:hypothetical protein